MRILEVREPFGLDSLAFSTRPDPVPGPRELVIRIKALALNYRDHLVVNGIGRWRSPEPRIPASDGAGVVISRGALVTRFKEGDRVATSFYPGWIDGPPSPEKMEGALGGSGKDGVYSECVVIGEAAAVAIPAHLSYEEASTLPCAGVTAWNAIVEGRPPRRGDTVVVLGTGGVALFAMQFANLHGARTVVTSSSDAKLARARELGACDLINYRTTPDWPAEVRRLTGGQGADLVVETVGGLSESIAAVKVGGAIAFIGFVRGSSAELDLIRFMGTSATIRAIDVGSRAMFESMNRAIEAGSLRPIIDRSFAFSEAREAFRYLGSGAHFGKVCIVPDAEGAS